MTTEPSSAAFADQFGGQGAASGTRVNSDPESLLRYGLPITNKEVREIQTSVEQTKANLRTRRQNFAKGDLQKTAELLNKNGEKVISSMPANHKAEVSTFSSYVYKHVYGVIMFLSSVA